MNNKIVSPAIGLRHGTYKFHVNITHLTSSMDH